MREQEVSTTILPDAEVMEVQTLDVDKTYSVPNASNGDSAGLGDRTPLCIEEAEVAMDTEEVASEGGTGVEEALVRGESRGDLGQTEQPAVNQHAWFEEHFFLVTVLGILWLISSETISRFVTWIRQ